MSALVPASQVPLAVALVVATAGVSLVYGYVGYRLHRRQVSSEARLASTQFALWWGGLGVSTAIGGTELALALAGALSFPLALTFYLVVVLVDCAFLWGLVGFLLFVYTGKYHLLELTAFYAWFYVTLLYYVFTQVPSSVAVVAGSVNLQYAAHPIAVLEAVLVLGLLGPELVCGILYFSLLRRTEDPARRYRIWLVAGGILLWFAIDVFVPSSTLPWALAKGVVQVVPGILSLFAFYPPAWARRRYGVTSWDEPVSPPPAAARSP